MKINFIPSYNNKSFQKYNSNAPVINNSLSFRAKQLKLVQPKIADPDIIKLKDKINFWIKSLPELSKNQKPIRVDFKEGVAGFMIDKKKNSTDVTIKVFKDTKTLDNWDARNADSAVFEMTLNKLGQMTEGMYYDTLSRITVNFERKPRNIRRITYANASYMPTSVSDDVWIKIVPNKVDYQYTTSLNKLEFKDTELEKLFSELAKLNVTFFPQ